VHQVGDQTKVILRIREFKKDIGMNSVKLCITPDYGPFVSNYVACLNTALLAVNLQLCLKNFIQLISLAWPLPLISWISLVQAAILSLHITYGGIQ